jgi:flagellar biosynthesis protein FlhB
MVQQGDSESKTEEPTEKKILNEFERGNIPISKEASLFATCATTLIILVFLARDVLRSSTFTLERLSNDPGGWLLHTPSDAITLFATIVWEIARPLIFRRRHTDGRGPCFDLSATCASLYACTAPT